MNAYTLIAKMRRARRQHAITAGAQALYYELVAINNEEEWSEVFKCTANELCAALGVSEKTVTGYRIELMKASLVGYISGKTKRCPSTYSLFGSSFGSMIGSNIYYQIEHPTEHPAVVKTPDLYKTKSKTETKLKKEEVEVVAHSRQNEFDDAVDEFFSETDKNSNASFPEQAHLPGKEKSSAKKEKEYPSIQDALDKVVQTANWRNVLEHHQVTEAEREELFKIFYEQKEDAYRIRYPTTNDMASHFYFWIAARKKLELLKPQLGITNANTITKNNTNGYRKRTEEVKRDVTNFKNQSVEFLRKSAG